MKILTWNVCCLPNVINLYQNPEKNIKSIIQTLEYYNADFICLQEMFDVTCIREIETSFPNYSVVYDIKGSKSAINSGLMILSKHLLIDYGFHEYKSKCGEDRMSCKGFIYGVFHYNNRNIVIYNTHLNNDKPLLNFFSKPSRVLQSQLEQLFIHVYKTTKQCSHIFVQGDFNSEPYQLLTFLRTFYATKKLYIKGFEYTPTIIGKPSKTIDHILHVTQYNSDSNKITMTQNTYNYNLFSDHYLVEKIIHGLELPR